MRDNSAPPNPSPSGEPWAVEVRRLAKIFKDEYGDAALLAACIVIQELSRHVSTGFLHGHFLKEEL